MTVTAPTRRERALQHEILRVLVGSTLNGLDLPGSDRDYVGIFVETPEDALGLTDIEHTIQIRDAAPNQRSQPGQTDLTLYSLRHFLKLAAKGNPSLLALFWAPPEYVLHADPLGWRLQDLRELLVTHEAGVRFLGYLDSQVARLRNERGGAPNRPELVAAHGYDTKFASHAVRLGLQGIELLSTGGMTLPMPAPQREIVLGIKRGEVSFADALETVERVRTGLINALEHPVRNVPLRANLDALNRWSAAAHRAYWEATE